MHLPTVHIPFTRAIEDECGSNQTKNNDGECICNAGFYRNPSIDQCTEECCYCTPANNRTVKECKMQKLGRDCGSRNTRGKCISNTTQEPKSEKPTNTSRPSLETTDSPVSEQPASEQASNNDLSVVIGICVTVTIIVIIVIIVVIYYKCCKKTKANQPQISFVSFTNNGFSANDFVQITVLPDTVQANGKRTETRRRSPQSSASEGSNNM